MCEVFGSHSSYLSLEPFGVVGSILCDFTTDLFEVGVDDGVAKSSSNIRDSIKQRLFYRFKCLLDILCFPEGDVILGKKGVRK